MLYRLAITLTDFRTFIWSLVSTLIVLLLIFGVLILSWYLMKHRRISLSPYTKLPLRKAMELPPASIARIFKFMSSFHEFDNIMFDIRKASYCRETGRLFPNSLTFVGEIKVDWTFLKKRYPGNWVSWGSLDAAQQAAIGALHLSLDGYQTAFSSPDPSPRSIAEQFAYSIPGPLYVDLATNNLLGWKIVPNTDLEVLIVQKPYG
jgi:hypothetical protein